MLVLLPQLQQLLKHLYPLRLQLPGIHQLLVVLPPTAHVASLRDELGWFAVVGFQKVDGFLPFGEPEFGLGHGMCIPFITRSMVEELDTKVAALIYDVSNQMAFVDTLGEVPDIFVE